jgi:beta-glucosidase
MRNRAAALALAGVLSVAAATSASGAGDHRTAGSGHRASPLYQDARQPVDRRVRDLLGRMTLEEKIGQMGQINVTALQGASGNPWDRGALNANELRVVLNDNRIGSILSGGGAWPPVGNDARAWAQEINAIQRYALQESPNNRLGIPIIYGADAVHGHSNLSDATLFPHQIGLGSTGDRALLRTLGHTTARAVRATGVAWNFAPDLDVTRDIRWGRSYEPYGEDPLLNAELGAANVLGQQGRSLAARDAVAATAKHFTGYGAPDNGHDRTDATISGAELEAIHLPPFAHAIDAGVATVMVNSGSVNGEPVHASHRLLTDVLRRQLRFKGVLVTDWQDVENLITKYHVATDMEDALTQAVNAGIDMSMIPIDAPGFTTNLLAAVRHGRVSEARIDQSVARILTLKFRLGLFERPYVDPDTAQRVVEDPAQRPLARRAAQESLVLLENDGAVPLRRSVRRILVTGPASDSPTYQLGGWSIAWQGAFNLPPDVPVPATTTIREGIEDSAPAGTEVLWRQGAPDVDTTNRLPDGSVDPTLPEPPATGNDPSDPATAAAIADAVAAARTVDAVVVAVGESPYAEGQGDDDTPRLTRAQSALVDGLQATGTPVIVVVVAGRPLVMEHQLDAADAALMAFWPGSEGGSAVADALFGRVSPAGRLTVSWPRSVAQIPQTYDEPGQDYHPRYAFGYGLSYADIETDRLRVSDRGGHVRLSVQLRNDSRRASDYVTQAFVERRTGDNWTPRQLVAFGREHLAGFDRTRVRLRFDADRLAPGRYRLVVGDESEAIRVR